MKRTIAVLMAVCFLMSVTAVAVSAASGGQWKGNDNGTPAKPGDNNQGDNGNHAKPGDNNNGKVEEKRINDEKRQKEEKRINDEKRQNEEKRINDEKRQKEEKRINDEKRQKEEKRKHEEMKKVKEHRHTKGHWEIIKVKHVVFKHHHKYVRFTFQKVWVPFHYGHR